MGVLENLGSSKMNFMDFRQTKEWSEYIKVKGWEPVKIKAKNSRQKIRGIVLKIGFWPWTLLKIQRSMYDIDTEDLKKIRKQYRVINTVIEPLVVSDQNNLNKAGFYPSKSPYLAMKTVVVDLRPTEKVIWKRMSENARRLINKNKEVEVVEVEIDNFYDEWKKWTKVWIMTKKELVALKNAFGNKFHLWVTKDDYGNHSGLLSLSTADTMNYYQTWTSELGRISGAHFKLVWVTMMWAKKNGLKYYDFEGIYDERYPIKKWKGFTEFKKKFGGEVITHPGSFTRWF